MRHKKLPENKIFVCSGLPEGAPLTFPFKAR